DMRDLLDGLEDRGWARTGVYNFPETAVRDVDWIARHTLHEVTHHLMDVDRALGANGWGGPLSALLASGPARELSELADDVARHRAEGVQRTADQPADA